MATHSENYDYRCSANNRKPSIVKQIKRRPLTETLVEASSSFDRYRVSNLIGTHFPELKDSSVYVVKNDFLETMYLLKKAEMQCHYGEVREHLLIHVTGSDNVESIVRENFDWRRVTRGKFGQGTSFSDDAHYANRYANYNIGNERAFIICRVLVSSGIHGHTNATIPPPGFDTTVGNDNKVFVKFSDNEVLPTYVIYYKCDNIHCRPFAKLSYKAPHNSLLEPAYYSDSDRSDSSEYSVASMDNSSSVEYTCSVSSSGEISVEDELGENYGRHDSDTNDSDLLSNLYDSETDFGSDGNESCNSQHSDALSEEDDWGGDEGCSEDDLDEKEYSGGCKRYLEDDSNGKEFTGGSEECSVDDLDGKEYSGGRVDYSKDGSDGKEFSSGSEEYSEDGSDGKEYSSGSEEYLEGDTGGIEHTDGSEKFSEDYSNGKEYSGGSVEYLKDGSDGKEYSGGSEEYSEDGSDGKEYSGDSEEYLEGDTEGMENSDGSENYSEDYTNGKEHSGDSEECSEDDPRWKVYYRGGEEYVVEDILDNVEYHTDDSSKNNYIETHENVFYDEKQNTHEYEEDEISENVGYLDGEKWYESDHDLYFDDFLLF